MFRFMIRDLLWLTIVVATVLCGIIQCRVRDVENAKLRTRNTSVADERDSLKWQLDSVSELISGEGFKLDSCDRFVEFTGPFVSGKKTLRITKVIP